MKTLNEVIKGLEMCISGDKCVNGCPYAEEDCLDYGMEKDALHYLKAFRDAKNALDAERERTIEAYCQWKDARKKLEAQTSQMMWVDKHFQFEISDNPPLTWDDLRQMEGKPVWIEYLKDGEPYDAEWIVIQDIDDECMGDTQRFSFLKSGCGSDWQAYRKEHE